MQNATDEPYEPTYKQLMKVKYVREWERLSPELRKFAELSEFLANVFQFDGPFRGVGEFKVVKNGE